jgi:uncharacterized protein YecE (DUF72 family)
MAVHIGTSGWQYRDWKGALYAGAPQRVWLERYAESFATVEVNNAFYRLPEKSTFEAWRDRTPGLPTGRVREPGSSDHAPHGAG